MVQNRVLHNHFVWKIRLVADFQKEMQSVCVLVLQISSWIGLH
jgi:hypothetical protein